ncbi:MAG: hypothetical protein A3A51_04560 [Candidatus Levybacteria bacterium RIFCSPLOWO2_01_FULL_39_10]|nr:MAG: hypothetical protein A3A51_04560 [Candidatus Levybacteria bacterium RIFCSPLOWO2_01_FULL_39_10]
MRLIWKRWIVLSSIWLIFGGLWILQGEAWSKQGNATMATISTTVGISCGIISVGVLLVGLYLRRWN